MKNKLEIKAMQFTTSEIKLMNQIWRQEYPDCASLEEVARRLALKGIKKTMRLQRTFNVYKMLRRSGLSTEEIVQKLQNKDLDWESAKKFAETQVKDEAKPKGKGKE